MPKIIIESKISSNGGGDSFKLKINDEKIVEVKMQIEELNKALNQLTKEEREIMEAIFYREESLRSIGKKEKVSYQTIGKRRDKILEKLRKILEYTI